MENVSGFKRVEKQQDKLQQSPEGPENLYKTWPFPLNFSLFTLGQRRLLIEHRMHLTSHSPHLQMTPNPSHPSHADLSRFILRSCRRPKNVQLVRVFMFHSFNVKGANGQEVHRRTRDLHFSLAFSLVVKSDGEDMQIWATNKWETIV